MSGDTRRALVPMVGAAVVALAPIEMDGHARGALSIATGMVLCWVADVLHPAVVGFVGCFLFRATGDVEFDKAFAGFGTTTPWFLYGALLLFGAADRSGLMRWLGAHTPRPVLRSPVTTGLALIAVSYLLALVVPSSLASATLVSILAVAWARPNLGTPEPRDPGTPLMSGLVLVGTYSSAVFGQAVVPGVGQLALAGWELVVALVLLGSVGWSMAAIELNRGTSPTRELIEEPLNLRMAVPVFIAAGLWATTPLHGISPALVGLGAGLACCLTGFAPHGHKAVNPDPLAIIFLGAAMSIPVVLVETRAADALSHAWLTANHWATGGLQGNLIAYWTTTAYRLFSPEGAQSGLPALTAGSDAPGLSPVWAFAGSTMLALHQSPALIFGLSVGGIRARQVLVSGLSIFVAGSLAVMLFGILSH